MSGIDQVFEETRQAYYRALVELQEDYAARFDALAKEENKSFGSEPKHFAEHLRYEATKNRRNYLQE